MTYMDAAIGAAGMKGQDIMVTKAEKIAELEKIADRAYSAYDRASRHMGANDDECSRLYFEQQRATEAWQAAVRAA